MFKAGNFTIIPTRDKQMVDKITIMPFIEHLDQGVTLFRDQNLGQDLFVLRCLGINLTTNIPDGGTIAKQ